MASGSAITSKATYFNHTSRNPDLTSGGVHGLYFPDSKCVILTFYAGASASFGTNGLFTIAEKYRPSSNVDGSGLAKHTDNTFDLGNVRVGPDGTISQVMTGNCNNCFGVIIYTL